MDRDDAFLFAMFSAVRSPEELRRLLDDLLTPRELDELRLRLDIARRLYEGQTYEMIQTQTRASSTTISRVRRSLHYGSGGYRTVLDRVVSSGSAAKKAGSRPPKEG